MKKVDSHTLIHTIMAESKKYQWVTLPLAIHGVVVKKDGTKFNVSDWRKRRRSNISITDLLPHLGSKQMEKTAASVIEGEALDILVGRPHHFVVRKKMRL